MIDETKLTEIIWGISVQDEARGFIARGTINGHRVETRACKTELQAEKEFYSMKPAEHGDDSD